MHDRLNRCFLPKSRLAREALQPLLMKSELFRVLLEAGCHESGVFMHCPDTVISTG